MILFDINSKQITTRNVISKTHCFFLYGYDNFSIRITEGDGIIYNAEDANNVRSAREFLNADNLAYTIYLPKHGSGLRVEIIDINGESTYFAFGLELENVLSDEQEHYVELLINKNLPTYEELKPALYENSDNSDIIKRLLLDFNSILVKRGTTESIRRFFHLLGYEQESIDVIPEYKNPVTNRLTTNPNTYEDVKTGNYHLLHSNWRFDDKDGLNQKNMPYRPFGANQLDEFFESLAHAIALANQYFTVVEQRISFFGIEQSVNIPMYKNITSVMNQVFVNNIYSFRNHVSIDIHKHDDDGEELLVTNSIQKVKRIPRYEFKYTGEPEVLLSNNIIYNKPFEAELNQNYFDIFGCGLSIEVQCPDDCSVKIKYGDGAVSGKSAELILLRNEIHHVTIEITDSHNNVEKYFYDFELYDDIQSVDFNIFTSSTVSEYQYVQSAMVPDTAIITDAETEYPLNSQRYILTGDSEYMLPEISLETDINDVTDTIPVGLIDAWFETITLKKTEEFEYNIASGTPVVIVETEIEEDSETNVYTVVYTSEPGIELRKETCDIKINGISIFDYDEVEINRFALNYDIPLGVKDNQKLIYQPNPYVTETGQVITYELIPSLLSHLTPIQPKLLKIGDVVICTIDQNRVVSEYNIKWTIYDAMRDIVVYETTDFACKYRIKNKSCYTILCEFQIDDSKYNIQKIGCLTSFSI